MEHSLLRHVDNEVMSKPTFNGIPLNESNGYDEDKRRKDMVLSLYYATNTVAMDSLNQFHFFIFYHNFIHHFIG